MQEGILEEIQKIQSPHYNDTTVFSLQIFT
ncbi:MAG: hypothetical protein PWQ43_1558 [Rikenellaceae bacterium]|jgi:hypothetical protein|nr:hypothetical protein [Rikenellaceae bacterium]